MSRLDSLYDTVFNYPAIDNHAHPLLKAEFRDKFPFELSVSEAEGEALTNGAIHTLACFRATAQLSSLFSLEKTATWEDVKARRRNMPYLDLCKYCMDPCKIQCLLLDDGLGGVAEYAGNISWHSEQFCETKRIVRIETEAEGVLKELLTTQVPANIVQQFKDKLKDRLTGCARDSRVVAFKSVVCYRTGLDVSTKEPADEEQSTFKYLQDTYIKYQKDGVVRLQHKPLNDIVVRLALEIAGSVNIPVQFHTGLGDNDLSLLYSSPAHLQPLIKAYPQTKIVLLHASYPYTKEAGYLTAVYSNVFLDFGEVFHVSSYVSCTNAAYPSDPSTSDPVGVIVCKQAMHRDRANRGYIAMLSIECVRASTLVRNSIEAMKEDGVEEVVLETEFDNYAALSLYESLGFIREKRLFRFYLNGKDAFRLVLPVPPSDSDDGSEETTGGKFAPRRPRTYRAICVSPYTDDEDEVSGR
ncbi:developmental protein [Moniliophthora roreri]|nr:developmental protein [Moniliophthora roreri]